MKMKQLFRYTSTLLRTALLLGVSTLVNTQQTTAQPVSITPEMPDAFETKNPVVGDGEYYYVQFYKEEIYSPYLYQSFLGELGEGQQMQAMDYLPFASNRLWTLVAGSDATHFKLKSKRGFYAYYDNNRFYTTATEANASEFSISERGSYRAGFKELITTNNQRLGRWSGSEWGGIINTGGYNTVNFVRFAKLKPTAAHIIYYRGEGIDNTDPQAATTRHYLTYSGTGNPPATNTGGLRASNVSSRQSIIPADKSLWTLPTAAAYHQDGLWTLEESGTDGVFFIKKYGSTDEYLNPSGTTSVLGTKDLEYGKYTLEDPTANRYTSIVNTSKYEFVALSSDHFYQWDKTTAGAASQSSESTNVVFNVGNNTDIGSAGTVVGTGEVWYHTYADMTGCKKLVIEGTPSMYLRVSLNRQVPIDPSEQGYDSHGGSLVQRYCMLDENGRGEVDVSDLPYVHINAIKNWGGSTGQVNSIDVVRPKLEPVSLAQSQFHYWNDLNAESVNTESPSDVYFHVNGYTISPSDNLVAGTGSVYYLTYADLSGSKKLVIKGTSGMIVRVILNRQEPITPGEQGYDQNGGSFVERVTTIGSNGYAEVDLSDLSYVHLNSIKVRNDSPSGTITEINLIRLATTGDVRYLHYDQGDGWQVPQWTNKYNDIWYAAFYPVEVPVPNKDEFFQVLVGLRSSVGNNVKIELTGGNMTMTDVTDQGQNNGPIYGASFTPTDDRQHAFQYTNFPTHNFKSIVIEFGEPVPSGWNIHAYGEQGDFESLEGKMRYEITLDPSKKIDDFTIFNWYGVRSTIKISACYFTSYDNMPTEMVAYSGWATTYSELEDERILWQLEQVDDYTEFRLKNPNNGTYLKPFGQGVTAPNDPDDAEVYTNLKFSENNGFTLKWFIPTKKAPKEIRVNHYVTHRESYLKQYSEAHQDLDLKAQGLATEVESDWWNFDGNGFDTPQKGTQKVNHFEITHYIKQGNSMVVEFPTVLNKSNDHIYFQRFFNYDEMDTSMDLDNLKAHVSLDTRDDGDVQYFLYNNGMVTGQKLDWRYYDEDTQTSIDIPDGGMARNEQRRFNFTNSDGNAFTVAVDVSKYSDMTYEDTTNPTLGNLEEPSLTMRYIYYMKDAKDMADDLTTRTESYTAVTNTTNRYPADEGWYVSDGNGGYTRTTDIEPQTGTTYYTRSSWKETKDFHFPARRIAYELSKKVGYRGEFIGLRHIFSDYWVYDDNGTDDENLVSAVNSNSEGKIEVEIEDPMNLGIRLGGWNPTLARTQATTQNPNGHLKFVDNVDTYDADTEADFRGFYFYDKMSDQNKTQYGDSRFVVFRYPEGGVISQPTYTIVKDGTEIVFHKKAYVNVYLNNNGKRYQLAQFTIIFDPLTQTIPWKLTDTSVTNPENPTVDNPLKFVEGSYRDPAKLVEQAGKPIAKITFDYPTNDTYHFPANGETKQGWSTFTGGTLSDCSPIPLAFAGDNSKTNYSFSGFECNWGSYSIVNKMTTNYGNHQNAAPANDIEYGYGPTDEEIAANEQLRSLRPDAGLQNGFLYIDASEQPGDICSAPFIGDFCAGDKLMFTGWISGSNKMGGNDDRCPGGITLTVKGEHNVHNPDGSIVYENGKPKKETVTLYRFCPGQCYELDDNPNSSDPDGSGNDTEESLRHFGAEYTDSNGNTVKNGDYIDANGNKVDDQHHVPNPNCDNRNYHVIWQQFYFEFIVSDKYDRHWIEVNNNCVSSQGGDFMLDNVEVYAIVPEVIPGVNTPLCVSIDENGNEVTDMRLLKLSVDFNKLKKSANVNSGTAQIGFAFLDKYKFLEKFKYELAQLTSTRKHELHLDAFDFANITVDELAAAIEDGELTSITGDEPAYQHAFDEAIVGKKTTWYSNKPEEYEQKKNSSILYFEWNSDFNAMEEYSFQKAVNKTSPVYREVVKGEKFIVMNGNFPQMDWKTNTEYYIIDTNIPFEPGSGEHFEIFNICSECTMTNVFRIDPPYHVLGLESTETTNDYVVCEGQIPTIVLNLKGFDLKGNKLDMNGINYDWWLGNPTYTETETVTENGNTTTITKRPKLATLENYHKQHKEITYEDNNGSHTVDVRLDKALSTLRTYYPSVTSLDGIEKEVVHAPDPALTLPMIKYLKTLVASGELVLHQTSVSIPAEKVSETDPYFYMVACPIHDDEFDRALNPAADEYVAYYCDEPQGLRIKVDGKAPRLQTGFVPGERGFTSYNYNFPEGTNPVLSIRLAKAAQFEMVKNEEEEVKITNAGTGEVTYSLSESVNYLWLPIRNALTEGASGVIKKSQDDNIYLASSNDLTWDKKISKEMDKNGSLPIVGRIVQLEAINTFDHIDEDTKQVIYKNINNQNDENRLCVYFTKNFEVREGYNYTLSLPFQEDDNSNACDGTILFNLKIVPDYEVWTGGAGNVDWNNDENWRRADGNTTLNNDVYGDELYRANGAMNNEDSPLHEYVTNKDNYYSSSKKANAKPSKDQILRKGFAPLYCTHVLMKNDEWGNAPVLYDALDVETTGNNNQLQDVPFPNLRDTSTPILKFDMQARKYSLWYETYGKNPDRGRSGHPNDLIAEMYKVNSCDEIAFQSGTELMNAHLLNYNSAWVEYQLDNKRWYLLGSPLQGTISGEWYAPTGTAKQETTYYDPVKFGAGYDRYSPAIYQRSWDKAKAVLYEVGAEYDKDDDKQDANLGTDDEGKWSGTGDNATWSVEGGGAADEYLDRLGYKPMGGMKANVAIKGVWSNTYNDAQVDYATGGFSVMVMNHLKNNDTSNGKSVIRLPKEDRMYDYYEFSEWGGKENAGGTDTELSDVWTKNRAKNRGRLKTDNLLPMQNGIQKQESTATAAIRYGDQRTYTRIPIYEDALQTMNNSFLPSVGDDGALQPPTAGFFTETIPAGVSNLGFYLVENPFPSGLDMDKFFAANSVTFTEAEINAAQEGEPAYGKTTDDVKEGLYKKYWILTKTGQHLVQKAANGDWLTSDGTPVTYDTNKTFYPHAVVAPGQGFFVQARTAGENTTINFNREMQAQSRFGVKDNENGTSYTIVVGQAQKMEQLVIEGEPQYIDVDLDGDGIYGEEIDLNNNGTPGETYTVQVEEDGETVTKTIVEREVEAVMVPVYTEEDDPDNPGQTIKIPVLKDIEEDVVIYKYKQEDLDVTHKKEYPLLSRRTRGGASSLPGLVITAQRGNDQSSALVMKREEASNDFLPSEDTETFICSEDLKNVPMVYTLCGRLATTINSIHDFRSLPLGVESASDALCVLTFEGVELLGDSIAFYDAKEQKLTPLESGMTFEVSGQTQNRYYLVSTLIQEEAAVETHLQIFNEGLTARVIASTEEPIVNVRCFDLSGRLIHTAEPKSQEYSFRLPSAGVYIIEAQTKNDRKTKKVMAK